MISQDFRKLIQRNIEGRKVLILFILTNALYLLMLRITIPGVMSYSKGMKLLDMMPGGYSREYVSKLFEALGEKGRHAYLFTQLPIDMVYPFLFGITYCLVQAYFFHKMEKLHGFYLILCIIPLLAGFFDYLENIGIISMLNSYPNNSAGLSLATNTCSVLKSILTSVSFIALIVTLVIYFRKLIVDENR